MNLKKIKEYCDGECFDGCVFLDNDNNCFCLIMHVFQNANTPQGLDSKDIEAIEKAYKEIEDVKLH